MTHAQLLLPLRIPELGPALGKLVTGTGSDPAGLVLDGIRYRLVTRVMEQAAEARRLAARGERAAAVAAVGRTAWLEAWEEAVTAVADLLLQQVAARLTGAAAVARIPKRRRRRLGPGPTERRALAARLGSAGAVLVAVLDALERCASGACDATPLERGQMDAWGEALTAAARRLEAAWLALEDAVEAESERWDRVVQQTAAWRKPLWPVFVTGTVLLPPAIWLGLVVGGYVAPPPWLAQIWETLLGP